MAFPPRELAAPRPRSGRDGAAGTPNRCSKGRGGRPCGKPNSANGTARSETGESAPFTRASSRFCELNLQAAGRNESGKFRERAGYARRFAPRFSRFGISAPWKRKFSLLFHPSAVPGTRPRNPRFKSRSEAGGPAGSRTRQTGPPVQKPANRLPSQEGKLPVLRVEPSSRRKERVRKIPRKGRSCPEVRTEVLALRNSRSVEADLQLVASSVCSSGNSASRTGAPRAAPTAALR